MPRSTPPALDFELLFSALPAPHAVLAPDDTVLALNAAASSLLAPPAAATLAGQPVTALHAALVAAGSVLPPLAAWQAGLATAQSGTSHTVAPAWQAGAGVLPHWEATWQPVPATPGVAPRYVLLRLLDVSERLRPTTASAQRLTQILTETPALLAAVEGPDHRFSFTNAGYDALTGHRAQLGQPLAACFPEMVEQGFLAILDYVYQRGETVTGHDQAVVLHPPGTTQRHKFYFDYSYQALRDEAGRITGVLGFAVDVTERVRARREAEALQAQMAAAAQRLRRQAEVLPIITFTTDAAGHSTYISPQWHQYTGQAPSDAGADVDAMWDTALHPDDRARAQREVRQSVADAQRKQIEVRLRGTSGEYRWFLTDAVPELDANGRLLRRYGYMLDVHELRETQRRLEVQDHLLTEILAQAPAYIAALHGPDHRYAFFNARYDRMLGHRARLGEPLAELQPEVAKQGYLAVLDDVYRTGQPFVGTEMRVLLPHKGVLAAQEHFFDFSFLPLHNPEGAVSGILSFALDATERVRARQVSAALAREVSQRDEQVRVITASVPVFIFNFDLSGSITYTNPYFFEYTGLDPAGPPDDAWLALPPDDRAAVGHTAQAAMAEGRAWQAAFRCRRHDGELRWFQTNVQPYTDAAGALAGFSAATVEVHELHTRTEELARSRTDFAALADNMAQLAWMADAKGHIFWYNQRWYDYTGLTLADMAGAGWQQLHDPARAAEINAGYLACVRAGVPWEDTFQLRRHDGQLCWFLSRARPIRDEATGAVVRWFGTNTDITELRELQQQLSTGEEELRIQAENIPQQVWTAQPDGMVDFYNHRTTAYLGQAMDKVGAAAWTAGIHPDDRAAAAARWEQAIAGQRYYEAEFRLRRYDGEYRWFLAQAQARRGPGGQVLRWYGTNTDVHQQRTLQDQVLQSQARFEQLLETLPQMTWTSRPDGGVNYYNQRWYDYIGAAFEDLRDWGWERFIHPDDYPHTLRRWQHSLSTGEPFETEHRWLSHDDTYRWFLARAEPLRGSDGAITLWVGANTDVHDFKKAQQQLEAQNARLLRTNEDLDNFVYTASHDLRQPITNMAGIFEELTRTAYFRDPDAVKLIDYFERALARIFSTIDDLSAIVQVQRLQQELPLERVHLQPLAAEVIGSLQDLISAAGAVVEFDFDTYPVVECVRLNLQSVYFNLLANSLKYAAPDRPPRIRLSSAPDVVSGRPVLTVQDNGLGIDLERYGTQLFQLFRRFHSHVEGTGMGLYLVNRIVQNHGGRLEVRSVVDEGTTFHIYL